MLISITHLYTDRNQIYYTISGGFVYTTQKINCITLLTSHSIKQQFGSVTNTLKDITIALLQFKICSWFN